MFAWIGNLGDKLGTPWWHCSLFRNLGSCCDPCTPLRNGFGFTGRWVDGWVALTAHAPALARVPAHPLCVVKPCWDQRCRFTLWVLATTLRGPLFIFNLPFLLTAHTTIFFGPQFSRDLGGSISRNAPRPSTIGFDYPPEHAAPRHYRFRLFFDYFSIIF